MPTDNRGQWFEDDHEARISSMGNKSIDESAKAHGDVADAVVGLMSNPDVAMAFWCAAITGGGLFFLNHILTTNFSILWIPNALWWIIGVSLVVGITTFFHLLLRFIIYPVVSAIFIICLLFMWGVFDPAYFKPQKAMATGNQLVIHSAPFANSQREERSTKVAKGPNTPDGNARINVYGVTDDGWAFITLITGSKSTIKHGWVRANTIQMNDGATPRNLRVGRTIPQRLVVFSRRSFGSRFSMTGLEKNAVVAILGEEKKGFVPIAYIAQNLEGTWNLYERYALADHIAIDGEPARPLVAPEGRPATFVLDEHFKNVGFFSRTNFNPVTRIKIFKSGDSVIVLSEPNKKGRVKVWHDGLTGYTHDHRPEEIGLSRRQFLHY